MSECCSTRQSNESRGSRLVIVGGGSAAFAAAIRATELGSEVVMINDGLPIGGTCVNTGCVPSKTLIRAAECLHRTRRIPFDGIEAQSRLVNFLAVVRQKCELVERLRKEKYEAVIKGSPSIRTIQGRGRFVSANSVDVNGENITATRFLIATGAAPRIPELSGLADVGYLTNESAFELDELPESLIVIGGRYIALECAQMFARFGTRVTILQRSDRILPTESPMLTDKLTEYLRGEGLEIVTGVSLQSVIRKEGEVVVDAVVENEPREFRACHILIATGREPNTANMGLENIGVGLDSNGFIQVDDTLRTTVPNVFAAGDVIDGPMFVYAAAYEGALAARNALMHGSEKRDYTAMPWVVFTDPQVAGVGLDQRQAEAQGIVVDVATLPMVHLPRCLVARDTRGFLQLIREVDTDRLVGARILVPEGAELLMELSLAIKHGISVSDLASSFHAYLTLGEAIKLAAISFTKDLTKLSCCAT